MLSDVDVMDGIGELESRLVVDCTVAVTMRREGRLPSQASIWPHKIEARF